MTKVTSVISFRSVKTSDEFRAVEEIQRAAWNMENWREVVPAHLLITAQKNGGLVLGAFDESRLIGFAFGFLGTEENRGERKLKHCSHMLAVLPEYQSRKIGAQLKWKQREQVLAQGIDLITWTYDPLQAVNANLNLARLGAIARRYLPDAYGEMTDGLNVGLASDRFEVEWQLNAPRVKERAERELALRNWQATIENGAQEIFSVAFDTQGLARIETEERPQGTTLLVEIPANINALKNASPQLAHEWRMRTREFFTRAFAAGYTAVDFLFSDAGGPLVSDRAAYLLIYSR